MIKNKTIKKSGIYKGLSLAFAGVFAASFFPVNVIESKADYQSNVGSEAIYLQNTVGTVDKGATYSIRAAYFGSEAKIPVGLSSYAEAETSTIKSAYGISYGTSTIKAIESDVTVTYLTTGEKVEHNSKNSDSDIESAISDPKDAVWGTFVADYAGEYEVTYSFKATLADETVKSFKTSMIVYSQVNGAYFEFEENDANVIPSVYDASLQKDGLKNINLPLPTVYDDNEKAIEDVEYLANSSADSTKSNYVVISIEGGNGSAAVQSEGGNFFIDSKYFNSEGDAFNGEGNYIVKYSYYASGRFVKSITKTFAVNSGYYKNYKLAVSENGSLTSAITGVASSLPTLLGKTDSKSTPASESVNIHYDVKAYRQVGSSYSDCSDDHDGSIADGKFTPWEDGNYKIVYSAEDFYGNKAEKTIFVKNVKDTQKPEAKIYDASNKANYVEGDYAQGIKEYIDASTALKSITGSKNIVLYAIGATDNTAGEIKYTRRISRSSTVLEITDYADKNLIFNYDESSFLDNNYYVKEACEKAGASDLETWLKENNFLIVTTDKTQKDVEGYAYIDANGFEITGDTSGRTYSIVYFAEDASGNVSKDLELSMKVMGEDYEDTVAPEITFVTNLKNSYRKGSVISFEQPTATDDDTRMDVVVEYQYDKDDADKWRTFADDKYELDLSEISTLFDSGNVPSSVTIRVYAVDDYGKKGEWEKNIAIIDVKDNDVPTIVTEKYNTPNTADIMQNEEIVLPTIVLSDDNVDYLNAEVYVSRIAGDKETALTVSGKSEKRNVLNGTYTLNAGKVIASYPGEYQVRVVFTDAGNNQITTFYNYQVKGKAIVEEPAISGIGTTIGDSGVGEVGEAIELATPVINYNIADTHAIFGVKSDDSKSAFNVEPKVVNNAPSSYKFNEDEENTFTAYEAGYYDIQYTVKFSVFNTSKFAINEAGTAVVVKLGSDLTTNTVYPLSNGDFMIVDTTDASVVKYAAKGSDKYTIYDLSSYFIYENYEVVRRVGSVDYRLSIEDAVELVSRDGTTLKFERADDCIKIGEDVTVSTADGTYDLDDYIAYYKQSKVLTLEVKDTKAPVMLVSEYEYPKTANKNDTIAIKKVEATDASKSGIDLDKSYVSVSLKGSKTSDSQQYYLSKWETEYNLDDNGNIQYTLKLDGTCTITYYIYDCAGNLNSDYSYTIAVGDTEAPKVTVPENYLKESYSLKDFSTSNPLTVDLSKIDYTDNKSSKDELKDTLKVELWNTTTNKQIENISVDGGDVYQFVPTEVGTYELRITVTDNASWESTGGTVTFEIKADENEGTEVYEVVGTVLIVVAVAILAGVVSYFVVSAVKRNKKSKAKAKKADKDNK